MMNRVRMPVLFIGHGSPMNAIANNAYTRALGKLHTLCPAPRAIVCISAHWTPEGPRVTHMDKPRTIHDFYGFPESLSAIQYPAPGNPEVAELVCSVVTEVRITTDAITWGLDHGSWSVLRHIYPAAEIPVVQLSMDISRPAEHHYRIGEQLEKEL